MLLRRSAVLCLFLCALAVAQASVPPLSPEVADRVQRQVRAYFNMPPDVTITVGKPATSEFPNYETLPVTMSLKDKTQTLDFLISVDGKTLIRMMKLDLTKDVYAETMSKIKMADRPVRGNPDAKVTIVNFDDFECPFCARMHSTLMSEILPQYQDKIKIVYKDYPLISIHPWAQHAANDANCLAKESGPAYWATGGLSACESAFYQWIPAKRPGGVQRVGSGDLGLRKKEWSRPYSVAGVYQSAVRCRSLRHRWPRATR